MLQFKRSSVIGYKPETGHLLPGEIAINLSDKKIYTKNDKNEIINIGFSEADATDAFLKRSGGQLTGPVVLFTGTMPGKDDEIVSKRYVDTRFGTGTNQAPTNDQLRNAYVRLDGGTMTGPLILNYTVNNSTPPNGAITKGYADTAYLKTTGGVLTGSLQINTDSPTILLRDTDGLSSFVHCNSNQFYVLRSGAAGGTTFDGGPNNRHPMTLNLTTGDAIFSGDVISYSDKRLKKDIVDLASPLDKVCQLRGVNYRRKGNDTNNRLECGFIAQEVIDVIPEVVRELDDGSNTLAINYASMVAYMAEAIKELRAEIQELKNQK